MKLCREHRGGERERMREMTFYFSVRENHVPTLMNVDVAGHKAKLDLIKVHAPEKAHSSVFPIWSGGNFSAEKSGENCRGKGTVQQSFWVREKSRTQMLFDEAVWENFPEIGATLKGESTEDGKNNS